jgi:hypothetical protein
MGTPVFTNATANSQAACIACSITMLRLLNVCFPYNTWRGCGSLQNDFAFDAMRGGWGEFYKAFPA